MVIQFSIPATDGCAPCCNACVEVGTLLDVTLTGGTLCGCSVTGDGKIYNLTATGETQLAALMGLHEDIPLSIQTTIGTVEMQAFEDECVTPDGDPVDVDLDVTVTCSLGLYTLSVTFMTPTDPSVFVEVYQASGALDESLPNIFECSVGTPKTFPFVIDSGEIALAA